MTQEKVSGSWRPYQKHHHINWLEMKAIHLVLQHWCDNLAHQIVLIESDNCHSGGVSQQARGDAVKTPDKISLSDSDFLRRPKHQHQTSTHPRKVKRLGRPTVKKRPHHTDRVVAKCGSFPSTVRGLGNTTDGSVRHQGQSTTATFCLSMSRSGGSSGGCDGHVMDGSLGVRVPAIRPPVSGLSKGATGSGGPCADRSTLARSRVVSSTVGNVGGRTQATSSTSKPVATGDSSITTQPIFAYTRFGYPGSSHSRGIFGGGCLEGGTAPKGFHFGNL